MKRKVGEVAVAIGARVLGDDQVEINGVASIANARDGDVVFVEEEKHLDAALRSAANAVITGTFADKFQTTKPLVIASHPRLAFAQAARLIHGTNGHKPGIHPSAVVHESSDLGEVVSIDALAVVHEDVSIADRTWIGAGCVLGAGVTIGEDCEIYPNVTIYPGARIGNRVIVHAGAVLGSDGFGCVRDRKSVV